MPRPSCSRTLALPKLALPKLALPKLALPKLALPSFMLPALVLSAAPARAQLQQICHAGQHPLAATDWFTSFPIPRFDPALGTLRSVAITLSGRVTGSIQAENLEPNAIEATLTHSVRVRLRRPDLQILLEVESTSVFPHAGSAPVPPPWPAIPAYDGVLDFAGSSGVTHGGIDVTQTLSTPFPTPQSHLDLFTGPAGDPGTVTLYLHSVGLSTCVGTPTTVGAFEQQASGQFQVCYTFDPTLGVRLQKGSTTPDTSGRPVEFTITVQNTGFAPLTDVEVLESVDPRWFRLIDVDPPGIASLDDMATLGLVAWRIPTLAPGPEPMILRYRALLGADAIPGDLVPGGPVWAGSGLVDSWLESSQHAEAVTGDCDCLQSCCPDPCGGACTIECEASCLRGCVDGGRQCLSSLRDHAIASFEATARILARFLHRATVTGPIDPNEKRAVNPLYIQPNEPVTYVVHFENLGEFPASYVTISDTLTPPLNLGTVTLFPPEPDLLGATGSYSHVGNVLTWSLTGGVKAGEGGSVQFVVAPPSGGWPGTVVTNGARIQFETQQHIDTPPVQNFIDGGRPEGTMSQLPPLSAAEEIALAWTGTDGQTGPLLYTVYASHEGGGYQAIFVDTPSTSGTFTGQAGSRYDFYCIARDVAGNTEQQAPLSEAFTTVSATAPSFCAGDGSSAPCPCGNQSALGAGEGCLNSLGTGGKLVASGAPSIAQADLLLTGSRMPSGTAAYFQGHSAAAGGQGVAFGDGLLCVSGSVFRLGLKLNVNGTSRYPDPDDPPVSVRGYTLPGAQRVYQCWYRNSADFCTASLFNLTNGLRVTWAP